MRRNYKERMRNSKWLFVTSWTNGFAKRAMKVCLAVRECLALYVFFRSDSSSGSLLFSGKSMRTKLPSPDGHYRANIATVYYFSRPPLSQNLASTPDNHLSPEGRFTFMNNPIVRITAKFQYIITDSRCYEPWLLSHLRRN